ncbi:MAG TPA: PQQ-dependent dehydrogenase, methanol/ethanol family [Vicinamibacteria bacterium]|nr:PQQ-dependent dehydrogenase, methanol/ethanol family [Vicinamibacteria bacterium]
MRTTPSLLLLILCASTARAQLTPERLLEAEKEPGNWLTYSGNYKSWRFSPLDRITRANVPQLRLKWVHQMRNPQVETTPLVVDGVLYLTEPPNDVAALDAETGRVFWRYRRSLPTDLRACCGKVNRGLAMQGETLFMGTLDAHLVALDARTGDVVWDVEVADYRKGYAITGAPLSVKNQIVTGIAGGEYGIRGFLDAYDAETGERKWRFYTVPAPGEHGNDTWEGDSWKTGGAPTWVTGSYDSELNLIVWGTGNPSPDWNGDDREGDNLYSDSAIALDADTGELKWHFQFVPHDVHDWDAVQVPVLVDGDWEGRPRRLVYWAHRGGFYYVLDRTTGQFLFGTPFAKVTWALGLDENGRPIRNPGIDPTEEGVALWPGVQGATNWYSPSYSPETGLFYLTAWENKGLYRKDETEYNAGDLFLGGVPEMDLPEEPGYGAVRALDPKTGRKVWDFELVGKPWSGVLSTASKLVFAGSHEGYFYALDGESGKELWRIYLGGSDLGSLGGAAMATSPITYLVNGRQHVSMASGHALFTFELVEP